MPGGVEGIRYTKQKSMTITGIGILTRQVVTLQPRSGFQSKTLLEIAALSGMNIG